MLMPNDNPQYKAPDQGQFMIWLNMHDLATVEKGITVAGAWTRRNKYKPLSEIIRYASGVMAQTKRDQLGVGRG